MKLKKKNKLGRNGFTRTLAGFTSSSKFYRVYGIGGGACWKCVTDHSDWNGFYLFLFPQLYCGGPVDLAMVRQPSRL